MRALILLACCVAPAALAAPRIDSVTVKPGQAAFSGGKAPQVEIAVTVARPKIGSNNCDASVDVGDGSRPKTLDFGVATTRTLRHVYEKNGTYKISVKGAGATPCEGAGTASVMVTGQPAAAKKKPEPKKQAEPKKKPEAKKKAEPKKPEAKKKGAEAPSSAKP